MSDFEPVNMDNKVSMKKGSFNISVGTDTGISLIEVDGYLYRRWGVHKHEGGQWRITDLHTGITLTPKSLKKLRNAKIAVALLSEIVPEDEDLLQHQHHVDDEGNHIRTPLGMHIVHILNEVNKKDLNES